jgi:sugar lactone lactonase YvrE
VLAGASLAALAGCAGIGSQASSWEQQETRRPPRIEWLGAIGSAADLQSGSNWLEKLKNLIFGAEPTEMIRPAALAINDERLLVVADPGVPTVHFFDLERRRYDRADDAVAAELVSPVGVALDDQGRAYVADSVQRRIFVLDSEGSLVARLGEGLLERPTGIALDPTRQLLYVVDTLACQVVTLDLSGKEVGRFGQRGAGPGELNAPTFLSVAPDGTLAVADSLNFRVQRFSRDGSPLGAFGQVGDASGDFTRPKGVGTDLRGQVYVADAAFENVQVFGPDGRLLLAFGGPGTGPGGFYLPAGVFVDASNVIWVADSFNRRVQAFRLLTD